MSRVKLVAAALAAVAVGVVGVATLTAGPAEGTADTGPLRWAKAPLSFTHPTMERDRIVAGVVRNASTERMRMVGAEDVEVVARDGSKLKAAAIFTQTFGRSMFDPTRVPDRYLPARELQRIGAVAQLDPGEEIPLTLSWREPPGGPKAVRIEYPGGLLRLR